MNDLIKYQTDHGEVQLSSDIIKKYLVPSGTNVTDQEVAMFIKLCEYQKLNPFLREVYLVKYGSFPASMVTGKETFTKRAERHPKYAGKQAGITIVRPDNTFERRIGSMLLAGETLVGGWAKVYLKEHVVPDEIEVSMEEYIGTGPLWKTKPSTMIRKVALVQALREAFPEEFEGLYSQEEINTIDSSTLPVEPVTGYVPVEPSATPAPVQQASIPATPPAQPTAPPRAVQPAPTVPQQTGAIDYGAMPLNFGSKHKGKTIREVAQDESSYLTWVVEKSNAADETKNNIKAYLASMKTTPKVAKPAMKDVTPPDDYQNVPFPDDTALPFDLG